jgi:hypothetical protein
MELADRVQGFQHFPSLFGESLGVVKHADVILTRRARAFGQSQGLIDPSTWQFADNP